MEWLDLKFFKTGKINQIVDFLQQERLTKSILPSSGKIFNALSLTPLNDVKVVILGQDPYPTLGYANGLAFSVSPGVDLPRSLQNIFKELETDLGIKRSNGDLTDWAKQGVLLLNTSLTVIEGNPGSHSNIGWNHLTTEIIRTINDEKHNVVFVLWGNYAQTKACFIDPDKHHVIMSSHPSPLSARVSFFGSKLFSRTNKFLEENNITPINW